MAIIDFVIIGICSYGIYRLIDDLYIYAVIALIFVNLIFSLCEDKYHWSEVMISFLISRSLLFSIIHEKNPIVVLVILIISIKIFIKYASSMCEGVSEAIFLGFFATMLLLVVSLYSVGHVIDRSIIISGLIALIIMNIVKEVGEEGNTVGLVGL